MAGRGRPNTGASEADQGKDMIKHIVMWTLKDKNDAPALKHLLEALNGRIPDGSTGCGMHRMSMPDLGLLHNPARLFRCEALRE